MLLPITVKNFALDVNSHPFQFRTFCPKSTTPVGLILFNHGFCEHLGYYNDIFAHLAQAGFGVITYDQRGAGNTARNSTEYGLTDERAVFADLDKIVELVLAGKEIIQFTTTTTTTTTGRDYVDTAAAVSPPPPPFFLWGHSMGGGITLSYGIKGRHRSSVRGFVACAPLITLHASTQPPWVLAKLLTFLAKRFPTLHFPTTLNLDHVTRDKANMEWLKNDPLVKNICTVGQMNDMITRGVNLTDPDVVKDFANNNPGDGRESTSVLVYHGDADQINWLEGSKRFVDLCPVKDKELWVLAGFKHSVHLEPKEERGDVEKRLVEWFKARI